MRGWLMANLFLIGMSLFAAAVVFAIMYTARALGVSDDVERTIVGWTAIFAFVTTCLIARFTLRRIEHRR